MSFNFVCDRIVNGRAYPALTTHDALPGTTAWQEFINHYPQTVPCELIEHCEAHGVDYNLYTVDDTYPWGSYYAIGIGFFKFDVDYFSLMSDKVYDALKSGRLIALFYYHEGDHPYKIKERLNGLCIAWQLPIDCFRFVSGNTQAADIPGCVYFPDHELLYWRRNIAVPPTPINYQPSSRDFTALSRTHKWWRATVMTDLYRNGLLENSYWSYRTDVDLNESESENSIEVDQLNIKYAIEQFLKGAPYTCDDFDSDDHNNHALVETAHYSNSRCNIVLETFLDTDQSVGAFLTEKTFKPIKHGQTFIIVGPFRSVATLRSLGYRVFDSVIDNSYDLIPNDTDRWRAVFKEIVKIKQSDPKKWFDRCLVDIEHNQQLFVRQKTDRLNTLLQQLKKL